MAGNLQQRIDRITSKAAIIAERYALMVKAKAEADRRIADLERENRELWQEVANRDAQLEEMRIASALAPDHHNVEEARNLLTELVREIDKCIKQLSI
ncbi:MAG: hypothetical protein K2G35_03515 [Duncaniella sp.]|nr:hypothetical protein [Duncaniella sp.]